MNIAIRSDVIELFGKRMPLKMLLCMITLATFLFNAVYYDPAWAIGAPSVLTDRDTNRADGAGYLKELQIDTFFLPAFLGHINDRYTASASDKIIVHIQDAHCTYAAQRRIADIIEYLNDRYGIDTINLEGGTKDYDLSVFTSIKDKAIREKTADYFMNRGLVNGAEYFAINNPEKVKLWGIEDTCLYIDNLRVYRESLNNKDETDRHLKALGYILSNLKAKIYSQELLDLDSKYSQYKSGAIAFKDYLSYIILVAKQKAIDIKTFMNISLLSQVLGEEDDIDFKKANSQRDDLINKLQKLLSKKALEELALKTIEYKDEKLSQKDFCAYLIKNASLAGVDMNDFQDFRLYFDYISIYSAVDKMKVMDEMDMLEGAIKDTLYQSQEQRELSSLSKNLAILKNIFKISLTRADYKYYIDNERSFAASNFVSFIKKEAHLYNIAATLSNDVANLDRYRGEISKFYEYSFKRDDVFLKNIKFARKQKIAVVVTGGFHTENMTEMFRKQGMSYISIMPAFSSRSDYVCPYFDILSGRRNILDARIISLYNSFLATPSLLNQLGAEANPSADDFGFCVDIVAGMEANGYDVNSNAAVGGDGKPLSDSEKTALIASAQQAMIGAIDDSEKLATVENRSLSVTDRIGIVLSTPIMLDPSAHSTLGALKNVLEQMKSAENQTEMFIDGQDLPEEFKLVLARILLPRQGGDTSIGKEEAGSPPVIRQDVMCGTSVRFQEDEPGMLETRIGISLAVAFFHPVSHERVLANIENDQHARYKDFEHNASYFENIFGTSQDLSNEEAKRLYIKHVIGSKVSGSGWKVVIVPSTREEEESGEKWSGPIPGKNVIYPEDIIAYLKNEGIIQDAGDVAIDDSYAKKDVTLDESGKVSVVNDYTGLAITYDMDPQEGRPAAERPIVPNRVYKDNPDFAGNEISQPEGTFTVRRDAGAIRTYDIPVFKQEAGYGELARLIRDRLAQKTKKEEGGRPLTVVIKGDPGSGKSFLKDILSAGVAGLGPEKIATSDQLEVPSDPDYGVYWDYCLRSLYDGKAGIRLFIFEFVDDSFFPQDDVDIFISVIANDDTRAERIRDDEKNRDIQGMRLSKEFFGKDRFKSVGKCRQIEDIVIDSSEPYQISPERAKDIFTGAADSVSVTPAQRSPVEDRQVANEESLKSDPFPGSFVRTVVGRAKVDTDTRGNAIGDGRAYANTTKGISQGLANKGFGLLTHDNDTGGTTMDRTKQVLSFEVESVRQYKEHTNDIDRSEARQKAIGSFIATTKAAFEGLPQGGCVVAYIPQIIGGIRLADIENGELIVADEIQKAFQDELKSRQLILFPDAYSDLDPENNRYPDYIGRVALGRHVAAFYRGDDSAADRISDQLQRLGEVTQEVISIKAGVIHFLRALAVKAIDYETIKHWQRSQEAVATSV